MVCGDHISLERCSLNRWALAVRELAAIQLQLYPLGHVGGAGIDGAGGAGVVEQFEMDDLQFALHARMGKATLSLGLILALVTLEWFMPSGVKNVLAN